MCGVEQDDEIRDARELSRMRYRYSEWESIHSQHLCNNAQHRCETQDDKPLFPPQKSFLLSVLVASTTWRIASITSSG